MRAHQEHTPDRPRSTVRKQLRGFFITDSELIPLESGETCVAAIMTAQSENSKLIIAAQKIDKDISIVREWLLAGKFPTCIQEFAPASYELKAYWIGRKSLYLDTENILWRNRSATGSHAQLVVPLSLISSGTESLHATNALRVNHQ